jgi:multimeric flavodoxin WrbA
MKVIGINGSPRPNGNTSIMITTVLQQLQAGGIETELIQLSGKTVKGCVSCFKCYQNKDRKCAITNDDFNSVFEKMVAADGLLLGSPTYFADITSELKALIDRAGFVARSNDNLFKHKAGAAIVVMRRAGGIHAFDTINHLFQISQMFTVGSTYWNIGVGREPGAVENDAEGLAMMSELGKSMAYLLEKLYR